MKDYFNIEEDFHASDRKASRKERKWAQQKDRSKFKKTDLEKKEKESRFTNTKLGRVISISRDQIRVSVDETILSCTMRGTLKQEKTLNKNLITIGDLVQIDERGQIAHIEKRYSFLARADNLRRRKQHMIAANIDQVFITASIEKPVLKPSLIDRYIIAAIKGNMRPIIVINKIDLLQENDTLLNELEKVYTNLEIPLIKISCLENKGLDILYKMMEGKTSVFSGQSGVGKSSLINALLGTSLKVGEVIERTNKGVHTTTSAELIPLKEGGFCVDTPGIKSFGLFDISSEELLNYFHDLQAFAHLCKFPSCTHIHEPECAVKKAVAEGKIHPLRYKSYLTIRENNDEDQTNPWD